MRDSLVLRRHRRRQLRTRRVQFNTRRVACSEGLGSAGGGGGVGVVAVAPEGLDFALQGGQGGFALAEGAAEPVASP